MDIARNKFDVKKLFELIPQKQRKGSEEKTSVSVDSDGKIVTAPEKQDNSRMLKHFPNATQFMQALSTWAAIKKVYLPDTQLFDLYFTKHIGRLVGHTLKHPWHKVLNYEVAFFISYSNVARHMEQWHSNDSDLYIDEVSPEAFQSSNANPFSQQTHTSSYNRSAQIVCRRYNKPTAQGAFPCDPLTCKYAHVCNFDPGHASMNHPAYLCYSNPNRNAAAPRANN